MIFGSQYYRPPFPARGDWARDMDHMRELGFDSVKLWAVWNWIEPRRGEFDFGDLDELVGIAKAKGLRVVINTIPEGSPPWTLEGNGDAHYTTKDGLKVVYGGPANLPSAGWPGLCPDKAEAAADANRFIERVAAHYAAEEAVFAIDVWNEPHLEPMFDFREDMLCYCEHSGMRFREWLGLKYGSLEALNAAWFRRYSDWSEVELPRRFGTWADMLDWRLFWIGNLRRWLRERVAAARRGAPGKSIQTHVAYSAALGNKMAGGLANELGDEFSLAPEVDVFGLSSFPKWLQGPRHVFVQLAHNEMVAEASRGKPFYQVELQGGAGKAGLLGGEVPTGRDVRLWNYNNAAAGGKGVMYWQYAVEPAGLESPGFGLVGFKGKDTERSIEAGRCARELGGSGLDQARRLLPVNAIYVSRKSEVLCFCAERKEALYAASLAGAYKAAYSACVPVRFVHEDYVGSLAAEGVRSLYMPMSLCLSPPETEAIARFVEGGGTVVGEAGFGLYGPGGLLDEDCSALSRIFGLAHVELRGNPDWGPIKAKMRDGRAGFTGRQYRHAVEALEGTQVLADFEDGSPALTERRLGAGRALFVSSFAALSYNEAEDEGTRALILGRFDRLGYSCLRTLAFRSGKEIGRPFAPVLRLHETETDYFAVVSNHLDAEVGIELGIDLGGGKTGGLELRMGAMDGLVRRLGKSAGS
jgi:beta-galactosidase GanA